MTGRPPVLAGIGSVTCLGAIRGPLPPVARPPAVIDRWPTPAARCAYLVARFRPADVVAGLKTRRLDRLSTWALVASALALQDAGIDPHGWDPRGVAVVAGTKFGCLDLTEEFMASIAANGYAKADPILFPETLGNLPASHIARQFGARGPNLTVSAGWTSGEAAVQEAVALLEAQDASVAIVVAGDLLTRPLYEWYESARMLAPACYAPAPSDASRRRRGIVPGEGLVALVLKRPDPGHVSQSEAYGHIRVAIDAGWVESRSDPRRPGATSLAALWDRVVGQRPFPVRLATSLARAGPDRHGAPGAAEVAAVVGREAGVRDLSHAPDVAFGEFGGTGLATLAAALDGRRSGGNTEVIMLRQAADTGCAAVAVRTGDSW